MTTSSERNVISLARFSEPCAFIRSLLQFVQQSGVTVSNAATFYVMHDWVAECLQASFTQKTFNQNLQNMSFHSKGWGWGAEYSLGCHIQNKQN